MIPGIIHFVYFLLLLSLLEDFCCFFNDFDLLVELSDGVEAFRGRLLEMTNVRHSASYFALLEQSIFNKLFGEFVNLILDGCQVVADP